MSPKSTKSSCRSSPKSKPMFLPRRMDSADHSLEYRAKVSLMSPGRMTRRWSSEAQLLPNTPGGDGVLAHLEGDGGTQGAEVGDQVRPGLAVRNDDRDAGSLIGRGQLAERGDGHRPSQVAGLEPVGELVIQDYEVAVITEGGQFRNDRVEESPVSVALERGHPIPSRLPAV